MFEQNWEEELRYISVGIVHLGISRVVLNGKIGIVVERRNLRTFHSELIRVAVSVPFSNDDRDTPEHLIVSVNDHNIRPVRRFVRTTDVTRHEIAVEHLFGLIWHFPYFQEASTLLYQMNIIHALLPLG